MNILGRQENMHACQIITFLIFKHAARPQIKLISKYVTKYVEMQIALSAARERIYDGADFFYFPLVSNLTASWFLMLFWTRSNF